MKDFARVERTLLSAAFDVDPDFDIDLDPDFDFAGHAETPATPWKSGSSAPRQAHKSGTRLQPPKYAQPHCDPERSMRIRIIRDPAWVRLLEFAGA
jgi:hypothetical protein